jgi:signal transduction histidine kinase
MSHNAFTQTPPDVASEPGNSHDRQARLEQRIQEKMADYESYAFTRRQGRALNIFFDLAQEYETLDDLLPLSVMIPKLFFGRRSWLYLMDNPQELVLRCCSEEGLKDLSKTERMELTTMEPTLIGQTFHVPIKGNRELISMLPFEPPKGILGLLVIEPADDLSEHDQLYFEKYANRIGFQLHNRILSEKNREHIEFIKNLVRDIGHNVIVPNMYFKLFFHRLESQIQMLEKITDEFIEFTGGCSGRASKGGEEDAPQCLSIQKEMEEAYTSLMEQFRVIYGHWEQTSLFLETLLRRRHFEEGRYVLEKRPLQFAEQIMQPQLDRYRERLEERNISVECGLEGDGSDVLVHADLGLISQVVANLLSNAAKYARPMRIDGQERKFIRCGWEIVPGAFEEASDGGDGLKVWVLTTGEHLTPQERPQLFTEEFRAANAGGEYGTGHGLYFIKEVVRLHGGVVGYEAHAEGNLFYFMLPLNPPPQDEIGPDAPGLLSP